MAIKWVHLRGHDLRRALETGTNVLRIVLSMRHQWLAVLVLT